MRRAPFDPPGALQIVSVHYTGGEFGGDVLVTFNGPVHVADWTPEWFQIEGSDFMIPANTVVQTTAASLTFNNGDFPDAPGTPWQLANHPPGLAAPYGGTLV